MTSSMDQAQSALLELGFKLARTGYRFTTPTPETHRRVLARGDSGAGLTDVLGWNKYFTRSALPGEIFDLLKEADCLERIGNNFLSKIRFSSFQSLLLAHSNYPTVEPDAVFFGPDTYRFGRAIRQVLKALAAKGGFTPRSVVDIGAGSGAGGLLCAKLAPSITQVDLLDINLKALRLCEVNAALNGINMATALESDVMAGRDGMADLIVSNPPYLVDRGQRAYRHGGGDWGCSLSLRILEEGMERLTENGFLLIYTGAPVVEGRDKFLEAATPLLTERARSYSYEEIDPDVFGEELEKPPYDQADRIAVVMLCISGTEVRR